MFHHCENAKIEIVFTKTALFTPMKKNSLLRSAFVFIILTTISLRCLSINDNIRLGLAVGPGIAWSNPVSSDLQRGIPHFGINYGMVFEYWFSRNYGLSTGLGGAFDGCSIKGRPQFNDTVGGAAHSVVEKYKFNYLELPVYLKLKTNDFKRSRICAWGQVGFSLDFTLSARATYSDSIPILGGGNEWVDKENIINATNAVSRSIPGFHANYFDIRLGVGAGIEYRLDDKTSLTGGLFYNNGLINDLVHSSPNGDPNLMRVFSFKIGVLF